MIDAAPYDGNEMEARLDNWGGLVPAAIRRVKDERLLQGSRRYRIPTGKRLWICLCDIGRRKRRRTHRCGGSHGLR